MAASVTDSIVKSCGISFLFVVLLYLWPRHRRRSDPATMKRRFISIGVASALSVLLLYFDKSNNSFSWRYFLYSLRFPNLIEDIIMPVATTALLFTGPILMDLSSNRLWLNSFRFNRRSLLQILRDYIIGPMSEEIVFRAINCSILIGNLSVTNSIFISSVLFGIVHFHAYIMQFVFKDMEKQNLAQSLLQIGYTTLFGMYVATVFLATKSLWASVIVHAFCNYTGLPNLSSIVKTGIHMILATLIGMVAWLYLFITYYLNGFS